MSLFQKLFIVILVLFLPVALMAVAVMPSKYEAFGLQAIDCDGPLAVMIFVIPCYLVYGVGLFSFGKSFYDSRRWPALMMSVFCGLLIIALSFNTLAAYKTHKDINHQEMCGEKW